MMHRAFAHSLALVLAATAVPLSADCHAGSFSVTPVRIYMGPRDRAVAITLVNEGDAEIALQAEVNTWSQDAEGRDQQELTDDMIVAPPILKLAPRAKQVVRLALLAPRDAARQLTYRLIVREVPEATSSRRDKVELPIALVLSMPVFVTPQASKRQLGCELVRTQAQAIEAVCGNSGNAYAQVREAVLKRNLEPLARFEGGVYILPGARKSIALHAIARQEAGPGPVQLLVTFDDARTETFSLALP